MTAEANECCVERGVHLEGDFTGSGEEIAGDSFVMVNGDSDGPANGEVNQEGGPDLASSAVVGINVGEVDQFQVNDDPSTEKMVGDPDRRVGKGRDVGVSLESGHDHSEGVVLIGNGNSEIELQTETDISLEKEGKGGGLSNGECGKESGVTGEEKEVEESSCEEVKRELPGVTGHAQQVASPLEEEENHEHPQEESDSAAEVGKKGVGEPDEVKGEITLVNGQAHQDNVVAEVASPLEAEEKPVHPQEELDSAAGVGEKGGGEPSYEEVKREVPLENGHGHGHQEDVVAEISSPLKAEDNLEHPQAKSALVAEDGENGVAEPNRDEVRRELPLEKGHAQQEVVAEVALPLKAEENLEHSQAELAFAAEDVVKGVGEPSCDDVKRELPVENGHAHQKDFIAEVASPLEVKENLEHPQEESALAAEHGEKGVGEPSCDAVKRELPPQNGHGHREVVVAEVASPLEAEENLEHPQEELASSAEDGEKLDDEIAVAEADQKAEFESSVTVEKNMDSEALVMEAKHQEAVESIAEEEQEVEVAVAETSQEPELESFEKIEEGQMSETVATENNQQREPEPVVLNKQEAELESAPNVIEEQKPETVATETDSQSEQESAVAEKQVLEAMVAGADQEAEPDSTPMVAEEQNFETVVAAEKQQRETEFAVAENLEPKDTVEEASPPTELEPNPEVEEVQKSGTVVKENDQQNELELSDEIKEKRDVDPESTVKEDGEHQLHTEVAVIDVHVESETVDAGGPHYQNGPDSVSHVQEKPEFEISLSKVSSHKLVKTYAEAVERPQVQVALKEVVGQEELKSACEVGMEQKTETVISDIKVIEVEENVESATIVYEPSDQLEMASEEKTETILETDDENESSETAESISIGNIDLECEMKFESNVNDGVCTASSVEGDQYMHKDDDEEPTCEKAEASDGIPTPPDELVGPPLEGEVLGTHAVKRQQYYIVRVPRASDDELRTKLQHARLQLEEKTRSRDSLRVEIQKKKATLYEYREIFEAAKVEERTARVAVSSKRQEIDSIQSTMNKMKNASSIDDINAKIHNMEHTLQHESITLPLEKQYIREIKQLKHLREQLSANTGPQAEIQDAFDRRDQIDEQFKTLKKELDPLRMAVQQADNDIKAARKKCDDEYHLLRDLQEQFRVADDQRQEAYGHMQNLRNELTAKTKHYNMYRDDQKTAVNYSFSGDKEGLHSHCSNQVERIMELWNNDEEFRKQYVQANMNSTLRRLRTLDGRSLGPDEEPPVLRSNYYRNRNSSNLPLSLPNGCMPPAPVVDLEMNEEKWAPLAAPKPVEQANQPAKSKKITTSREAVVVKATVSSNEEVEKAEKEIKQTKEEEELARKAEESARKEEELRKEKAAAELKEQLRLEQKAKAKEAEERKRRKAEKAQAKAEYKAQKEAEFREKKREKKKKKSGSAEGSNGGVDGDYAPAVDTAPPETAMEAETAERAARRRSSRPQTVARQYNKIQPLPLPLRNKGRRKMQTWMWVLLTTLLVLILFLAGNYVSFSHLGLPNLGL